MIKSVGSSSGIISELLFRFVAIASSAETGAQENGVPRMVLQTYEVGKKREIYYLEYPSGSLANVAMSSSSVVPIIPHICDFVKRASGHLM